MLKLLFNISFFLILVLNSFVIFSQKKELEKAEKQYNQYAYINARENYLKVIEKGYRSADLLKNLANSYYFNREFVEAEKWYKELINSYPEVVETEYYFRYAQTLKALENYEISDEYMRKFSAVNINDQRATLFQKSPDYLERIDFQSGRFDIKNSSINSPFVDFGTAFYEDHIIFSSSRDNASNPGKKVHQWNKEVFLDLYKAKYDSISGEVSQIEEFSSTINTKLHESTPIFTRDGKTMYFTRNNLIERKERKDKEGTNRLKIFRSYLEDTGEWVTPESLSFNDDEYSTAHPALSPDEKTLYFSSDMPGGKGLSDIYSISINSDGSLGEPKNMGDTINTEGQESFPFVSKTNDLYFASNGHIGLGGHDVYVTRLNPQTKEEALIINIGKPVNSPKDDFAFIVDTDTKRGYFSSNRDNGSGKDDIYSFLQLEDLRSFCESTISGVVIDRTRGLPLSATEVFIYDDKNVIIKSFVVGDDGAFSHKVNCNETYFVRAEKESYVTEEMLINSLGETQTFDASMVLDKATKPVKVGDDLAEILQLNPINFDFNKSNIRPDAAIELAKVIEVLTKYPKMKIDIRSHTDSRGRDSYNLKLSDKRAKSTREYIIQKGISADRLTAKGYGESQVINRCKNGVKCSDEEHQLNRRSEFIVVK